MAAPAWAAGLAVGCSAPVAPPGPAGDVPAAAAADWPQWRGPGRDGVSPAPHPPRLPAGPPVRWTVPVEFGVSSPVVAGGRVVAMGHVKEQGRNRGTDTVWCLDGRVACLDAATGALRWSRKALEELGAGALPQYGFASAPLVAGGLLVVDLCRVCVGLDAATGAVRWTATGGGSWNGSAPVPFAMEGVPCVVYGEQPVRCVEAATGRERWAHDIGDCATPTPVEERGGAGALLDRRRLGGAPVRAGPRGRVDGG